MIHVNGMSMAFGGQKIFNQVNWHIGPHEHVGLVGNNGSGKSTLMKLLAGIHTPDEGKVSMAKSVTIGYLPQDGVVHEGRTLIDECSSVFGNVKELEAEEKSLLDNMANFPEDSQEYEFAAMRLGVIHDHLRAADGYNLEMKVEKVLVGLGFKHSDIGRLCQEFSGGWQMRIALAKVLLAEPNLLLLDEPTNYLDLEAREFLETWLKDYPFAILLVSHDRFFLDQVVTRITDCHDYNLIDYHCNYSQYLIEREERVQRLIAQAERIEEERERITSFIERFRYKASKAVQVQSRVKQLEKLEKIELPSVRRKIHFNFPQPERSGKIALEVKGVFAGYEGNPNVLKNISFDLPRGDKVALVGINGAGKSTLMKCIAGHKRPDSGEIRLGHNVTMDYFAQDIHKTLDKDATVYETLKLIAPFDVVPHLRNLLGAFLFTGDAVDKKTSVLSGGERNRLALARMLLVPSNLLLMDEPTNHLDLDAKEVLLEALQKFDGTVMFVSHDRYFLDQLATRVLALDNGEMFDFPGTYPDFLYHLQRRQADAAKTSPEAVVQKIAQEEKAASKQERVERYKEDKKRQREKERLQKLISQIEEETAQKENRLAELTKEMCKPEFASDFSGLEKLVKEREQLEKEIQKLTEQWEENSILLEETQ